MGFSLPKTPIVAIVSQVLAFIFAIILIVPGPNGFMENTYILSVSFESNESPL